MNLNPQLVALSPQVLPLAFDLAVNEWMQERGIQIKPLKQANSATLTVQSWHLDQVLSAEQRPLLRALLNDFQADMALLPAHFDPAQLRVLAIDMDSTLINIECIDEIADFAGQKAAVAKITEATMRGEIRNFSDSLQQRVALLAGVSEAVLEAVYRERLRPNPGAAELIAQAKLLGLHTLLVSGGFTFFTNKLQHALGFHQAHANSLEIQAGFLTGKVLGNIIDGAGKAHCLEQVCQTLGCNKTQAMVIGDGANDLLMMAGAGLSIAYRAKPLVKEKADAAFDRVGLDAALALLR
ncbi:phosphoserine phosphatase SerB [Polynucleobacter sp. IMCC30063]|nr:MULTISPECIES: phosphoserine phosphatase SerB [unclassified Polynucleobacter]MCE7506906.1 phosphoserine phosphatase SerB [Polynucleobacter sp. IMCC30063]MCE7528712.1 phosphoserine phosphatase SerB [Polynucleobacter sp. IMCC 29146]